MKHFVGKEDIFYFWRWVLLEKIGSWGDKLQWTFMDVTSNWAGLKMH
jgi:hypothetical protein